MKRKLFTAIAVILLAAGLAMLIVPRISNRVGEQIAHTTVEDFKEERIVRGEHPKREL